MVMIIAEHALKYNQEGSAVHAVSYTHLDVYKRQAYDIIEMYKSRTPDEICAAVCAKYPVVTREDVLECLDDIAALEAAHKLFTPDDYEELAGEYKERSKVIKALCLHVAHTCNPVSYPHLDVYKRQAYVRRTLSPPLTTRPLRYWAARSPSMRRRCARTSRTSTSAWR